MADIALMELWLDRKRLDALEEALAKQDSSVETSMQEFFLDLYTKMVPLSVQEKIEGQLRAEDAKIAENAASYAKQTVYRVTEDRAQHCFQTDVGSDILITAIRLKESLSGPAGEAFQNCFPEQMPVSAEQFSQLAMQRMDGTETIAGVYDLNFDRGELSFVEAGDYFDSLDPLFHTHTCTADNNDFLTACASYDAVGREVCNVLKALRFCEDGSTEEIDYALNAVERECLRQKMEEYCQQQTGMTLVGYSKNAGIVQADGSTSAPQPLTGFDLMESYAAQCVSELADRICIEAKPPQEESGSSQDIAPGVQGIKPMM